jgi:spore cortex biosynthesis protein YabQ
LVKSHRRGTGGEVVELASQVTTFVMTIMTGALLGVLFDLYRVLRRSHNPSAVCTWFTDLLYWLVATTVIFIALVFSNWGELRFYVFIGILSGLGLYYNWLSIYTIRLFAHGIRLIVSTIGLLRKIVSNVLFRPTRYCMRMICWPVAFSYRKMIAWYHVRWPPILDDEKNKS